MKKKPIHERLTSMDSLSYSIISYGVFYGIKQAAFFYVLFTYLIPINYLRVIPAMFFGYFISRAMLNTSVNISEKKEWVITSIAFFDFLVLCVITDVLKQTNWIDVTNLLIFNAFVTYLGFWLNQVFVKKVKTKQQEAQTNQAKATLEHTLAILEQNIAASKENLAILEQNTASKLQEIQKLKQEIEDKSCPYCSTPFSSKKARDAHKGRCPENPKNIEF
ncbi:hypothetical protein ACQY1Q_05970 [Tenacibaculum sp. TC6]|uniref:hypothetical protein n=1 Tax=Tenacibaculum sp. TC6 TaxID=3423223 RepID=UPI003D35C213